MKAETRETLEDIGFDTIKEYLQDLADEHGVSYKTAYEVYKLLGESELFDGVVSAMKDAERYGL